MMVKQQDQECTHASAIIIISHYIHIIEAECDTKSHLLQRTFFVLRRGGRGSRRKRRVAMEMEINALSMVIHYYPIKTTREREIECKCNICF